MRCRSLLRIGGWVFVCTFTTAGLSLLYPGGPTTLVSDVQDYRQNADELSAGEAASQHIDTAIAARIERQQLRSELCGQLACGGVSLRDAADTYLQVLSEDPEFLARIRDYLPDGDDEQRVAVALVRDTFSSVPMSASGQQALIDQFQATFGATYPLPAPTTISASDPVTSPRP